VKYKVCIFSTTEKCDCSSFTVRFLKVLCRVFGRKRSIWTYRQIMPTYIFMRAFTYSLQTVSYIFVVSKFWKIFILVQPSCLSVGKADAS